MKKYKILKTHDIKTSYKYNESSYKNEMFKMEANLFIEFMPKYTFIFNHNELEMYEFPIYEFQYIKIIRHQSKIYEKV